MRRRCDAAGCIRGKTQSGGCCSRSASRVLGAPSTASPAVNPRLRLHRRHLPPRSRSSFSTGSGPSRPLRTECWCWGEVSRLTRAAWLVSCRWGTWLCCCDAGAGCKRCRECGRSEPECGGCAHRRCTCTRRTGRCRGNASCSQG